MKKNKEEMINKEKFSQTNGINEQIGRDGSLIPFYCDCGGNVFQGLKNDPLKVRCNSCGFIYDVYAIKKNHQTTIGRKEIGWLIALVVIMAGLIIMG